MNRISEKAVGNVHFFI